MTISLYLYIIDKRLNEKIFLFSRNILNKCIFLQLTYQELEPLKNQVMNSSIREFPDREDSKKSWLHQKFASFSEGQSQHIKRIVRNNPGPKNQFRKNQLNQFYHYNPCWFPKNKIWILTKIMDKDRKKAHNPCSVDRWKRINEGSRVTPGCGSHAITVLCPARLW